MKDFLWRCRSFPNEAVVKVTLVLTTGAAIAFACSLLCGKSPRTAFSFWRGWRALQLETGLEKVTEQAQNQKNEREELEARLQLSREGKEDSVRLSSP